MSLTLYIGNKAYSSWSLRGWLPLKLANATFEEVLIPFDSAGSSGGAPRNKALAQFSPSGRVPALRHDDLVIWDSLAICEYVAELFPDAQLWPASPRARGVARSVSAEMHSGFSALRSQMNHNVRRAPTKRPPTTATAEEIARILQIWRDCRREYGADGPFLFGRTTIADVMYAPVVNRFVTYGVDVDESAAAYMATVRALPAMLEWNAAGERETWRIEEYEE
jgi:glutathione S-transferase